MILKCNPSMDNLIHGVSFTIIFNALFIKTVPLVIYKKWLIEIIWKAFLEVPRSMISDFELSNENYDAAFKLLKGRFNKTQLQIAVHMKNLLKILTVSDLKNISLLRYIYDNIETQIRSLDNVTPETYGIWLIPLLQSNFPSELNLITSCKFNQWLRMLGCYWSFKSFQRRIKC